MVQKNKVTFKDPKTGKVVSIPKQGTVEQTIKRYNSRGGSSSNSGKSKNVVTFKDAKGNIVSVQKDGRTSEQVIKDHNEKVTTGKLSSPKEEKITEYQKRVSDTFKRQGYDVEVKGSTVTATRKVGGREEIKQVLPGGQIKTLGVSQSSDRTRLNIGAAPTTREQEIAGFREQARREGRTVKATPIIEDGKSKGLAFVAEEQERVQSTNLLKEQSESQRNKRPSLREKVDTSLDKEEGIVSFYKREATDIRERDPLLFKVGAGYSNAMIALAYGSGSVFKSAREKPIRTVVSLALLSAGLGAASRGITFATGLALPTSKAIVGVGALGGFLGYKEIKEPGSVTTVPGALSTASEFGSYALGIKAVGVAGKATYVASPRYIPFAETTPRTTVPEPTAEVIPQFQGSTRVGTSLEQISPSRKNSFLFSTTSSKSTTLFGPFSKLRSEFGKSKLVVKEPKLGEVGGERAKFKESFFFFSRGETYPIFGEQAVGRLGQVPRGEGTFGLIKSAPKRFGELFLRGDKPIILRAKETVSPFKPKEISKIKKGFTGSGLRETLGFQIRKSPGKIFPGPRTSALGSGELEFVAAQGTTFYRLSGPQRVTYSPSGQQFQKVIDIGLKPGVSPKGPYNLRGRLYNIADISMKDIFGIKAVRGVEIPKQVSEGRAIVGMTKLPKRGEIRRSISNPIRVMTSQRRMNSRGRLNIPLRREISLQRWRGIREREQVRGREGVRERNPIRVIERVIPRTRDRTEPRDRTRVVQRERNILRGRERPSRVRERTIRIYEEIIPPPPPGIIKFGLDRKANKKKKEKRYNVLGAYNPQIRSAGENIFGKSPKILTGISFERPIIKA